MIAVLFLFSAAAFDSAECGSEKNAKGMYLTKKDNGGKFKITTGGIIRLELQETGSTGYAWYFDGLDMDYFEALKDKSVTLTPDEKTGKPGKMMAGAPMIATWMLMARKKGQSELKLLYYRIWEGPKTAVDSFSVQVEIE